jgi:hypothetical protein
MLALRLHELAHLLWKRTTAAFRLHLRKLIVGSQLPAGCRIHFDQENAASSEATAMP